MSRMPLDTIRGRISDWIERHADKLGDDVLEVGSRIHNPAAWYLDNRYLARGSWLGVDMQPGQGVDVVADVTNLPSGWSERFTGVLCSEVLEHVDRPWLAVPEMFRVLRPGGWIVVTVPFGFFRHGFPSDFYRYTAEGLGVLLADAGFVDYQHQYGGEAVIPVKNHDHRVTRTVLETQLFGVARRPC